MLNKALFSELVFSFFFLDPHAAMLQNLHVGILLIMNAIVRDSYSPIFYTDKVYILNNMVQLPQKKLAHKPNSPRWGFARNYNRPNVK